MEVTWEKTYESVLSGNRVHVALVDGNRLEFTFLSHDGDTTWGEGLSPEDTGHLWVELEGVTGGWS